MSRCLCQTHRPHGLRSDVFESTSDDIINMLLQDEAGIMRVTRDGDQVFVTVGTPHLSLYGGSSRREPDHVLVLLFESEQEASTFEMFFRETQAGSVHYVTRPLAVL